MRSFAKTYERYLKELPEEKRTVIEKMKNFISNILPDAQIIMKWGMPVFHRQDDEIIAIAAQKQYCSLYIWRFDWKKEFASKIKNLNTGKECIRFTKFEQLPLDTIGGIVKRSAEVE